MIGRTFALLFFAMVCSPDSSRSAAYTWFDEDGVVYFSDTPPESGWSKMLRFDEPCALKQEVEEGKNLGAVVILGTLLGGMDESNAELARRRLSDKYQALALPLHDLKEYCNGGDQLACACLASIVEPRPSWRR